MDASVSLCMIVKNEEKYIKRCLASVKDIVNEMIIVDTGSTDETISIAKSFKAEIFHYDWNDSFSDARNFSIQKANCEWVLIMDADEEFEKEDKVLFLDYVRTSKAHGCHFRVNNYIGNSVGPDYTVHNAFRLLRNNKEYEFKGDIHEQITRMDGQPIDTGLFDLQNIRLHHYGYLNEVVKEKNKRKRSKPILIKELEKNPEDSFTLFNLGNEFLAEGNYGEALELYTKAFKTMDINKAYAPHLIYRRSMCLYVLKRYDECESVINEGLSVYPLCTDFVYLKGCLFKDQNRYTMAIDNFVQCINMGDAPSTLKFTDFCSTVKPLLTLGEMYCKLQDYGRALDCYTKLLNSDPSVRQYLYNIADILYKKNKDKNTMIQQLSGYFSSMDYVPNLIVFTDILIKLQLYDAAQSFIDKMNTLDGYDMDKKYLQGLICFYRCDYQKSKDFLNTVLIRPKKKSMILPAIFSETAQYLCLIEMLLQKKDLTKAARELSLNSDEITSAVYEQCVHILNGEEPADISGFDVSVVLATLSSLFDKLLKVKEFQLFEKLLNIYNFIDSKNILIHLAQTYDHNDYGKLAGEQVLRSIKELNYIDPDGIEILYRNLHLITF